MPHRLLLADDSVTIQRVIELTFADEDITVTAVGDGQQAIDRIEAAPPDIVLADVGMPGRDGYEVASFIKDRPELSHIPVLLLTGAFEPVDEARARQVRCDGVLAKPFEPQLLIGRVKELLGRAPTPASLESGDEPGEAPAASTPVAAPDEDVVRDVRQMLDSAPPAGAEAESSLDDYFDRLDQAFANLAGTGAASRDASARPGSTPSWAPQPPPAASWSPSTGDAARQRESRAPSAPPDVAPPARGTVLVADAFTALLEAESSGRAVPDFASLQPAPATVAPAISEDTIEEVVRRVMDRLGLDAERVARTVSEVAERLVREEIERLKAAARP